MAAPRPGMARNGRGTPAGAAPAPLPRGSGCGGQRGATWCRFSARRASAGHRQRGRAAPRSRARASPLAAVPPRRFFPACPITPTWPVRGQGGKAPPRSRRRAERPPGTPAPRPAPPPGRSGAAAPNTPAAPAEGRWGYTPRVSHPLPRRCPVAVGPGEGRAGGERAAPKGLTGGTWAVTRHWADYVQQTKSVCLRASPSLHRVRLHRAPPAPPPARPGPAWSGAESPRQPARSRLCATVGARIIPTVPGEYRRRGPAAPRRPGAGTMPGMAVLPAALPGLRGPAEEPPGAAPAPLGPDKGRPGGGSAAGPGAARGVGGMRRRGDPNGARRRRGESSAGAARCRWFRLAKSFLRGRDTPGSGGTGRTPGRRPERHPPGLRSRGGAGTPAAAPGGRSSRRCGDPVVPRNRRGSGGSAEPCPVRAAAAVSRRTGLSPSQPQMTDFDGRWGGGRQPCANLVGKGEGTAAGRDAPSPASAQPAPHPARCPRPASCPPPASLPS